MPTKSHLKPNAPVYRTLLVLFCLCLGLGVTHRVFAAATVAPGALELKSEQRVPSVPGDMADDLEEKAEKKRPGGGEFVIAPLPSRSPLLGWTVAVPALYLYKPPSAQPEDSVWMSGLMGFYTENESWGAAAFHKMSLGGDRWRLMGAAFVADLNYDYFGIGGDPDTSIPISQSIGMVLAEGLRSVREDFYLGLRLTHSSNDVSLGISPELLPPGVTPPELGRSIGLNTLAPRLKYDNRDSEFYPGTGNLVEGTIELGRELLGSDSEYEKYKFEFNHYQTLWKSGVIAARANVEYLAGEAPFFVYPAFGTKADLRGYQTGSYRDRYLFAAQVEYRHRITPRIGAVGFAGIGTVAPDFGKWGKSLPSVGVGLRWVIAPKNNMSLRFDIARGRDDTEFYIGMGEAF